MILLQNKRLLALNPLKPSVAEFYVDEAEYAALKKNKMHTLYNILSRNTSDKKAEKTVEVMTFINKHKEVEKPVEVIEPDEVEQVENDFIEQSDITDIPITKPHIKKHYKTKNQNR